MSLTSSLLVLFLALVAVQSSPTAVNLGNRITVAKPAAVGQFPWMVAVRHSETFICGGALIHKKWVLTSGECVFEYQGDEDRYSIFAGGLSILTSPEPGRYELAVSSVYPHPKFRMGLRDTLYYYNIGLMLLTSEAPNVGNIQPIGFLPSGVEYPLDSKGTLSGWGGTNSRVSPVLQFAELITMKPDDCSMSVGDGHVFNGAQVCTKPSPAAACWYDHGGPLVGYYESGTPYIIGVTAYAGCFDPVHPTIYTNPSYVEHSTWISELTGIII